MKILKCKTRAVRYMNIQGIQESEQPNRRHHHAQDRGINTNMNQSLVIAVFITVGIHASSSNVDHREICDAEHFSSECQTDEVVRMISARYGRMRIGRCVEVDLGYIGCSTGVLGFMDQLCSGRPTCTVQLANTDERFAALQPCIKDLKSYLELEYTCIKVTKPDGIDCHKRDQVQLTSSESTLSSHVTDETACGSVDVPWVLRVSPGQRIGISMSDFGGVNDDDMRAQSGCQTYGYISEPDFGVNQTLCGGLARERRVYVSSSNHVVLQIMPKVARVAKGAFLIHYKVEGCPDISPPPHAWYKRNGSAAVVGCEWSEHSWHLWCEGNTWVGVVGNCSAGVKIAKHEPTHQWSISPLVSVSLIIGLGVLVVVLFCVALIGCICILSGRKRTQADTNQAGFQPSDQQQAFLYYPGRPVPVSQPNTGAMERTDGPIVLPTKPTTTDELIHIWETPLPIPKQAQSSTGASENSATMSARGTLPGPPQVYKDGSTMSRSDYSTDTYWAGTDRYFDNDLGWVTLPKKE